MHGIIHTRVSTLLHCYTCMEGLRREREMERIKGRDQRGEWYRRKGVKGKEKAHKLRCNIISSSHNIPNLLLY